MKQVNEQFRKLEQKQLKLHWLISSLTEETYFKQPNPKSWSIAQAANHLYMSETLSLAYLKKKLAYPDTIPPFHIKSWGALAALKFAFYSRFKFKAPRAINMWKNQLLLPQAMLEEKWKSNRLALFEIIRLHQNAFGPHLVYKHPFVGRLTMYQMLIFFNAHRNHHLKQIRQIKRQLDN